MEGDSSSRIKKLQLRISTHALRMEGDGRQWHNHYNGIISTHALRMEGDQLFAL